jgi:hypothetical protein
MGTGYERWSFCSNRISGKETKIVTKKIGTSTKHETQTLKLF